MFARKPDKYVLKAMEKSQMYGIKRTALRKLDIISVFLLRSYQVSLNLILKLVAVQKKTRNEVKMR